MENYFNYFTEIEEHFQNRRGTLTLLSPLDWSLIESFQSSGIPLEVVRRGIDRAFEKHSKARSKIRKVNSLAYCTQTILTEFERHKENLVGGSSPDSLRISPSGLRDADKANLIQLLNKAIDLLKDSLCHLPSLLKASLANILEKTAMVLEEIKTEVAACEQPDYEQLEMRLSTLEEKVLASLISGLSEEELLGVRSEVQREVQRHRRDLKPEQMAMLERKMIHKRLFDHFRLPRLSLFYLPLNQ